MKTTNPKKRSVALEVLAMGGGVQTTTILLMACQGKITRPDVVIFADLHWEPPAVQRHVKWLKLQAQAAGIPFKILDAGNIRLDNLPTHDPNDTTTYQQRVQMPFHTLDIDGHKGMLRRHCTLFYKIRPIDAHIRNHLLGTPKHKHCPAQSVHLWFGISTDEARRRRRSDQKWKTYVYPLLNMKMSRHDNYEWLNANGYHRPAKSACVGCPYRSNAEWLWLKEKQPETFQQAVQFDKAIRRRPHLKSDLFIHHARVPLDQVDFQSRITSEAPPPENTDCLGYCGQ